MKLETHEIHNMSIDIVKHGKQHYSVVFPGESALSRFIDCFILIDHVPGRAYADIAQNTLITARPGAKELHFVSLVDFDSDILEIIYDQLQAFARKKVTYQRNLLNQ